MNPEIGNRELEKVMLKLKIMLKLKGRQG